MSDASMPHCDICEQVQYDCDCDEKEVHSYGVKIYMRKNSEVGEHLTDLGEAEEIYGFALLRSILTRALRTLEVAEEHERKNYAKILAQMEKGE